MCTSTRLWIPLRQRSDLIHLLMPITQDRPANMYFLEEERIEIGMEMFRNLTKTFGDALGRGAST